MTIDPRRYAPVTSRNQEPILAVLKRHLPLQGHVLEIASGTGEHVVHFAGASVIRRSADRILGQEPTIPILAVFTTSSATKCVHQFLMSPPDLQAGRLGNSLVLAAAWFDYLLE